MSVCEERGASLAQGVGGGIVADGAAHGEGRREDVLRRVWGETKRLTYRQQGYVHIDNALQFCRRVSPREERGASLVQGVGGGMVADGDAHGEGGW